MYKYKILELFGGIGAPRQALENIVKPEFLDFVDYVENDKKAVEAYNLLYNENFKVMDVKDYKPNPNWKINLLFHGSPCQDFSQAGKGAGGEKGSGTKSSLLFETIRVIKEFKKPPTLVIWENVKGVLNKNHKPTFDKYLDEMRELGYLNSYRVLNSLEFGIPQNRQRVFVASIYTKDLVKYNYLPPQKPIFKREMQPLKDFLEQGVDLKYYIKQNFMVKAIARKQIKPINSYTYTTTTTPWRWNSNGYLKVPLTTFNQENYLFNLDATIPTITATGANSRIKLAIPIKNSTNYIIVPRKKDGELISGSYNRFWKVEKKYRSFKCRGSYENNRGSTSKIRFARFNY